MNLLVKIYSFLLYFLTLILDVNIVNNDPVVTKGGIGGKKPKELPR